MKERPQIIIVAADAHLGSSFNVEQIINKIEEQGDVIIIGSGDVSLPAKEQKENPFENPPIPFKNYREIEPLRDIRFYNEESNPYPSPKGRRGKRKW